VKKELKKYFAKIGSKGGKVQSAAKREAARARALKQWAKIKKENK